MKNILLLLFTSCTILSFSQEQPKVGLVLSGGGAKGFAHVSVLKEIDKAGIQLDYIGGTSMGGIIGGLYAVGYSGEQIEQIIITTDFTSLLRDALPRSSETFFEKEYGEKTVLTLPVDKRKIGLPKGISKGQNVLNFLFELIDNVPPNQDFSKLPTPFFCVATDVENGAPVILEKGSLPLALRATGSIPSILNPIEIDNKLLIDGGIANNFPVSILKEKGMDIVIGVDVEGKLFQKDKINSLVSIMNQVVSYKMYNKTNQEKKNLDVYIHPDIYNFSIVAFDKKLEILEKGTEKAQEFTAIFKEIAAKQSPFKKELKVKQQSKKVLINYITIAGLKNYSRAFILGKLNIREGDSLSREDITQKIYLLSATRNYNRIEYDLVKKTDHSYVLNFKVQESNEYANIKLGVHFDLLYNSSVLATYNQKHVLKDNDLFSLDMILGDNLRFNLNYFVDNGFYISYGFRSRYNHFKTNTKFSQVSEQLNVSNINLNYSDITNQLFLQTTFNRKFALGLGVEQKFVRATSENIVTTLNPDGILEKSNYFNTYGYLKLDTYNKKYFATKGYFADLEYKWYVGSTDYTEDFLKFSQAKGTLGFAKTFFNRLTLQNTNQAGFTIGSPTSNTFDFYLGGYNQNYINTFVSLYGYDFADISGNSFLKTLIDVRYQIVENHYVSVLANYARVEENVFKDINIFDDIKSGYAVGYSYNSFLGPIELKYSWSPDTKESSFLFNLGFWF